MTGQLTELGFATDTVKLPKGELILRGISLDDILQIVRLHGAEVTELFDSVMGQMDAEDISLENPSALAPDLAKTAPGVVASIIAYAADDPAAASIAKKFPFAIQVECLSKIAHLTFDMEGGAKKLLETLRDMAATVNGLMVEIRAQKNGSPDSDAK